MSKGIVRRFNNPSAMKTEMMFSYTIQELTAKGLNLLKKARKSNLT